MTFTIAVNDCNAAELEKRAAVNVNLEEVTNHQTHWFDAPSPEEYRRWRREGLNGFPKPFRHPDAYDLDIPSSHGEHTIPMHVVPAKGEAKGVYLHFHAGQYLTHRENYWH